MGSGLKIHLGACKYTFSVIVNLGKFFLYVYYTTKMCTAFGINYYIQKNKHSHAVLQNGIFEQLYIILPIDYNNMTLIAALNINQSTNRVEDLG